MLDGVTLFRMPNPVFVEARTVDLGTTYPLLKAHPSRARGYFLWVPRQLS